MACKVQHQFSTWCHTHFDPGPPGCCCVANHLRTPLLLVSHSSCHCLSVPGWTSSLPNLPGFVVDCPRKTQRLHRAKGWSDRGGETLLPGQKKSIQWIGFVGKIYGKPWFLPSNIGVYCKFSHHPILWSMQSMDSKLWTLAENWWLLWIGPHGFHMFPYASTAA